VSDVWIGVIGTAIGGLIGAVSSWLVHLMQRADTIAERTRTERSDAYRGLLTSAEDSLHRFQWLAEAQVPPERIDEHRREANYFYDREVTPRHMVLKIFGPQPVIDAASGLRKALNDIRKLIVEGETMPADVSLEFDKLQTRYRTAREAFIKQAEEDLRPKAGAVVRALRFLRRLLKPKAPR
jgi:hypothetical protein